MRRLALIWLAGALGFALAGEFMLAFVSCLGALGWECLYEGWAE